MENNSIKSFLLITSDTDTLNILKNVISKTFLNSIIYHAIDGNAGWDLVEHHKPNIVISDLALSGFSGMQLIKKIRENKKLNNIYFIIMASTGDKNQKIRAFEEGANDYFDKPLVSEDVTVRLQHSMKFAELSKQLDEENNLLQQVAEELSSVFTDTTALAVSFIQCRLPESTEMLDRVADASVWIARQIGGFEEDDIQDLLISSQLCLAGKMFLPDNLIKKPVVVDGIATHDLMYHVPTTGKEILSNVKRFATNANTIYHIFENYDGSGFPAKLRAWQIPAASRIIRVALDYEERCRFLREAPKAALSAIQHESKRLYDNKAVVLFEQHLVLTKAFENEINEQAIQFHEMKPGMTISRDIITYTGLKLLPSGAVLNEDIIKKILSHNTTDPILGHIFIKF